MQQVLAGLKPPSSLLVVPEQAAKVGAPAADGSAEDKLLSMGGNLKVLYWLGTQTRNTHTHTDICNVFKYKGTVNLSS